MFLQGHIQVTPADLETPSETPGGERRQAGSCSAGRFAAPLGRGVGDKELSPTSAFIMPPHLRCLRIQAREGRDLSLRRGHHRRLRVPGPRVEGIHWWVLVPAVSPAKPGLQKVRARAEKVGSSYCPHLPASRLQRNLMFYYSFIYSLQQRKGKGWVERVQAPDKRQKWTFPSAHSCFLPQGSQWNHVCEQWNHGSIPDPGDPQLPGPCQQGTGCWDFITVLTY